MYGTTEAIANITTGPPWVQERNPGSIGRATYNWDARVVEAASPAKKPDPTALVEYGETGELLARGPGMCDGYVDRPEAEEDLFVDGWLRTGDIIRVTEEGDYFTVDRIDNMIVTGGENVYPQEVENVLEEHDGVQEAAVLGESDKKWGDRVVAVVVTSDSLTSEDLDQYCKEHYDLARYKRPRRFIFAEEPLPRSPLGKLRRGIINDKCIT